MNMLYRPYLRIYFMTELIFFPTVYCITQIFITESETLFLVFINRNAQNAGILIQ